MKHLVLLALVVAAIAAAGPLLHDCPLQTSGPVTCTWCVGAIASVRVHRPIIAPTRVVAYRLVAAPAQEVSHEAPLPLPSRAPPAL